MVCRLVQQQNVGLANQLARNRQTLLPSAGQRERVQIQRVKPYPPGRDVYARLALIFVGAVRPSSASLRTDRTVSPGLNLDSCGT